MRGLAFDVSHLLAGSLVLVSFMLLYQDRLSALLNIFALHAFVLALSVAWQAYIQGAPHLYVTAVIALVFKAIVIPVAGLDGRSLGEALHALCVQELLQETGSDEEYRFWHPLTQEVAYASLLAERRRRLHAAVAEAMTVKESDRLDELAAVLAWHWEQAGRRLEAGDRLHVA